MIKYHKAWISSWFKGVSCYDSIPKLPLELRKAKRAQYRCNLFYRIVKGLHFFTPNRCWSKGIHYLNNSIVLHPLPRKLTQWNLIAVLSNSLWGASVCGEGPTRKAAVLTWGGQEVHLIKWLEVDVMVGLSEEDGHDLCPSGSSMHSLVVFKTHCCNEDDQDEWQMVPNAMCSQSWQQRLHFRFGHDCYNHENPPMHGVSSSNHRVA